MAAVFSIINVCKKIESMTEDELKSTDVLTKFGFTIPGPSVDTVKAMIKIKIDSRSTLASSKEKSEFSLRFRKRDGDGDGHVTYVFTKSESFLKFDFFEEGYLHASKNARSFCIADYYRAGRTLLRSRLQALLGTQAAANAVVNTQSIENTGMMEAEIAVQTDNVRNKGVLPAFHQSLLNFMELYDNPNMPLNSIALTLVSTGSIYVRHQSEPLPKFVQDLLVGWMEHVGTYQEGKFAILVAKLRDERLTAGDLFGLDYASSGAIFNSEVRSMILALQYLISQVAERADGVPQTVPNSVWMKALENVDVLARRVKVFHRRNEVSPIDLFSATSEFVNSGICLKNLTQFNNNKEVENFVMSLQNAPPAAVAAQQLQQAAVAALPDRVADVAGNGPRVPPNSGDAAKTCNKCFVKGHIGKACPWNLAEGDPRRKTRKELKAMPEDVRRRGPA